MSLPLAFLAQYPKFEKLKRYVDVDLKSEKCGVFLNFNFAFYKSQKNWWSFIVINFEILRPNYLKIP